ncbi:WG repeat-containing protein [Roseimaritima ulvae]|uniref:KWG Leptospira n=1 Tax=Roseimaritima ulvae TaxID=980254 RepID=A0A5B9R3Z9_9BACT|nr:WG repeat-containing protein [Roseimaritima ulvae]QEG41033.1 KWG Leptospira [Roseimaritima ulvae]
MQLYVLRTANWLCLIALALVAVGCDTGDTARSARDSAPSINLREARQLKQVEILASLPDKLDGVFPILKRGEKGGFLGYGLIDRSGNELVSDGMYTHVSSPFDWDDPIPFRTWIGQDGAILLAEDHYLYVGPHGKRVVLHSELETIAHDRVRLAKNHGDSLFTLYPPFLRNKHPEWFDHYGLIPIGILDMGDKWQSTENVFPRHRMTEGVVPVSNLETGKAGYADREGTIVIDLQFDYCAPFREGLAAVLQGDLYGYIDREGNTVLEPQFSRASWFDNGLAIVTDPGSDVSYQIDRNGKKIRDLPIDPLEPAPSILAGFCDGLRMVKYIRPSAEAYSGSEEYFGYLESDGKWLFEPKLEFATEFREGRAIARFPSGPPEFPVRSTAVIGRSGEVLKVIGGGGDNLVFSYGLSSYGGGRYYDSEGNRVWDDYSR